jgi:RecA/RadA recombinase
MQFSLTNISLNSFISSTDEIANIIHIWGDVGVGKTTLCYSAALSKLVLGKKVIYINTKSYFKEKRFKQIMKFYPAFDLYNFILYTPTTFSQQTEILMNLEFLVLEELNRLKKTNIGLIILDSASILRHLQMKSDSQNQKTLRTLNTTIATLDYLRRTYHIPIIVTSRSVIRIIDKKNIAQPAGNAVMEYWAKIWIAITRTENNIIRKITLQHHPTRKNLPQHLNLELSEKGFI